MIMFSSQSFSSIRIHVRRTDKQSEAAFHNISEYMKYVEDYYIVYQYQNPNTNFTKRIYLATDEPSIFEEIRIKYGEIDLFCAEEFFCFKSIQISRLCCTWKC